MRFMIMHRTNAHYESGAVPSAELIGRVGKLIGEMAQSGVLLAGEGLRSTSRGVRLHFPDGERTVTDGPFTESKEVIGGFAIMRLESLEDAIAWATKFAQVLEGEVEMAIRPVPEPWDIGMMEKPAGLTTTRYLATHKRIGIDGCQPLAPAQRTAMGRLMEEMAQAGILLSAEGLHLRAKGACLRLSEGKPTVMDGPFAETKELLGGFVIVKAESLQQAIEWALRYHAVVDTEQVEVRLVAEPP